MATKQQSAERQEAIAKLRETLKPGDTVYTILRHVSRSGMQREISLKVGGSDGILDLDYLAARAMNDRIGKHGGIVAGGCGMDMGFALVYNLGSALWRDGFDCIGGSECRSNDHTNVRRETCPICGTAIGKRFKFTRKNRGYDTPVCSQECAEAVWRHKDGGYALQQVWL